MRIISIDIGIKNFALAYVNDGELIDFKLLEIPEKSIVNKCLAIHKILKDIKPEDYIIVERQVNKNVIAMCLMYSIVSFALTITPNVYVVSPMDKFFHDNLPCPSVYKDRKRLSVNHVYHNYVPDSLKPKFKSFRKKDDIADAIFMAFTFESF